MKLITNLIAPSVAVLVTGTLIIILFDIMISGQDAVKGLTILLK